jgi:hypothetical protein
MYHNKYDVMSVDSIKLAQNMNQYLRILATFTLDSRLSGTHSRCKKIHAFLSSVLDVGAGFTLCPLLSCIGIYLVLISGLDLEPGRETPVTLLGVEAMVHRFID